MSSSERTTPEDWAFARALGQELRLTREHSGLIREDLAARLSSGIGYRTILTYEQGIRNMSVARLREICAALNEDAGAMVTRAARRAEEFHIYSMLVNIPRVAGSRTKKPYGPVRQWALNRLGDDPTAKIVRLEPPTVRELAAAWGLSHQTLAAYLAQFTVMSDIGAD